MKRHSRELNSFEELVKKTKDVEAMLVFQPRLYIRKTDQHYLRDNQPEPEKIKGQYNLKDPKIKESKAKPRLSASQ